MSADRRLVLASASPARLALLRQAEVDLRNAGVVAQVSFEVGEPGTEVTLAPEQTTA